MTGPGTHPLIGNQLRAVSPEHTVWLSASAGTGKTQVLSSRVLRLLLRPGVDPSQILCLTFTKAGAAEMAARINARLARWVRLGDVALTDELRAIGAEFDPVTRSRARRLFARVLDCPGGGLRIDTIHAFSQWLLATFPHEAGLEPGTKAMEDRDRLLLLRKVLAEMLVHAEVDKLGDPQLLAALSDLSLRIGPDAVESWLLRCAEAREAWIGPGSWQAADMRVHVLRLLGLPSDADDSHLAALCGDDVFDCAALRTCLSAYEQWNGKKGQQGRVVIGEWLQGLPAARLLALGELHSVLFTLKDTVRDEAALEKLEAGYAAAAWRVLDCSRKVRELQTLLALADRLVPALRLGRAFALAWDEAKQREGFIDFDDQIRVAARLLGASEQADWIRYKLDRRFDHVLIDEAQDTNAAQWRIIDALTGDFFAGLGQRDDVMRTLFVVGDYKQAIFRFQGTSPENFEAAHGSLASKMNGAAAGSPGMRGGSPANDLLDLDLGHSFRTAQPLLEFVDRAIKLIGHGNLGLSEPPAPHRGEDRPGTVTLWQPVANSRIGQDLDEAEETDGAGPDWLSRPDRQMAELIARQVRQWLDEGYLLVKGGKRRAGPGDIMVLVRKRRELAGLIVARLHAAGVPVAGVDRLRLGAPLAVRDLMAAVRFAAQPLDDLNLASLLVSPLIGWSQEQLLEHGYRERGVKLWDHLRRASHPDVAAAMERLTDLLRRADFSPPRSLLHWILVGPWQGRSRLATRLGHEVNDPIDELLNAADAYAAGATPSPAGFINWFDAGKSELKRETGEGAGLVRVMTAHGSKGLEAPIVILADATGNPEARGRDTSLAIADPLHSERVVPLPGLRKEERIGRIAEEAAQAAAEDMKEHWRLLYVAMTRAKEALFIGGPLGLKETEPAQASWYARLRLLFDPADETDDPIFGGRLVWGTPPGVCDVADAAAPSEDRPALPDWLGAPLQAEPRPARPLAPSSLGDDASPDPPWPPGSARQAARRGVVIHRLLERLPEVPEAERERAALDWLERNAADLPAEDRAEALAGVLRVLARPDWAELFGPDALPEVPIAALVGTQVVAGTIDRLLVGRKRIRLIDFKSARRVPASAVEVPASVLRQMAAYALALEATYPGRSVEAAVLYTAGPVLIDLPGTLLVLHKHALQAAD